ncbi:hypothetical protein ABBQ38_004334 [Trebouxia sp. C0009 RCD-2024]
MYGGYDAGASQFAGGGFMPSPAHGADAGSSPAPAKTRGSVQTLRALTVKQIYEGTLNASDDQYRVDGEELHNITLVGKITSTHEAPTHLSFTIDDGTGKIELSYWTSSDDDQDQMAQRKADWRVGVYVRVHGHLRSFENKKSMVVFSLKTINDFNEVSFHFLQCIFQHVHLTKGQAQPGSMAPAASRMNGGGAVPAAAGMAPDAVNNMDPVQRECWSIYNNPEAQARDTGISIDDVIGKLHGKFSVPAIRQAIEWLANEGHLYTTHDDQHFKSTAM